MTLEQALKLYRTPENLPDHLLHLHPKAEILLQKRIYIRNRLNGMPNPDADLEFILVCESRPYNPNPPKWDEIYFEYGAYHYGVGWIQPQMFKSLTDALLWLMLEIIAYGVFPDIEDDRIVVYAVSPSGKKEPVWAFQGWHWFPTSDPQFKFMPDGCLPEFHKTLYSLLSNDEHEEILEAINRIRSTLKKPICPI